MMNDDDDDVDDDEPQGVFMTLMTTMTHIKSSRLKNEDEEDS